MIIAPCAFLGIHSEVSPRDMAMMPDRGAAHAIEKLLGSICASATLGIGVLMIDPLHWECGLQIVPRARFVSHNLGSLGDADAVESG